MPVSASRTRYAITFVAVTLAFPATVVAQSAAYSFADIESLIESGVAPSRIAELTRRSCIDFEIDAGTASRLREVGATPELLTALRNVCSPSRPAAAAPAQAAAPRASAPSPPPPATVSPARQPEPAARPVVPLAPVTRARRVAEEQLLARQLSPGVFRVIGNETGLGFLVDSMGLVLTHAQLLRFGDAVSVQVDSVTHVPAVVVDIDEVRDVAVLAIDRGACGRCRVLPLFMRHDVMPAIRHERLLTVGWALDSSRLAEVGLVREVGDMEILTDMGANAGATGAPLVNLDGEVIAINMARVIGLPGGERIARALLVRELEFTLERARRLMRDPAFVPPRDVRLPVLSRAPVRPAAPEHKVAWDAIASTASPFTVTVMTPAWIGRREQEATQVVEQRRLLGRSTPGGRADPIQLWPRWDEIVRTPAFSVVVSVTPAELGVPFHDVDRLVTPSRGDFALLRVYRNGVELVPVERSRFPALLTADELRAVGMPVAYQGVHLYRAEEFLVEDATFEVAILEVGADAPVRTALPAALVDRVRQELSSLP